MAESTVLIRDLAPAANLGAAGRHTTALRDLPPHPLPSFSHLSAFTPAQQTLLALLRPFRPLPIHPHTDWDELAAAADRLWLSPRLGALVAGEACIPDPLRQRWLEARRATAARNLLFECEEKRLLASLSAAGVAAIPLKGVSLARILSGDPAMRPVTDIDLGVRAADLARAADVLRAMGYHIALPPALLAHPPFLASTDEYTAEVKCSRDAARTQLAVELHWKWLPLPENTIWQSLHTYDSAGVRTLSLEHYFLFLCSHVAGGGWAGLRWLCDIAAFLRVLAPQMDAARCLALARDAGLLRAAGITLALVADLLEVRCAALQSLCDPAAQRSAQQVATHPFQPFLSGSVAAIHRDRLRMQDNPWRRCRYLARLLHPAFQDWLTPRGELRPAVAAWASRSMQLARLGFQAIRPQPAAVHPLLENAND